MVSGSSLVDGIYALSHATNYQEYALFRDAGQQREMFVIGI